jgi:UDPglucose--hexose-1-phosphate uridylyltransferase
MTVGESTPEVRLDQLTGLRTILAPARADRPMDFGIAEHGPVAAHTCPFCEGNEQDTPAELWADRPEGAEGGPGWLVRAVPNLYPALGGEVGDDTGAASTGDPLKAAARAARVELFERVPANGEHEVIVHSPEHLRALAQLDERSLSAAVNGWRERIRAHRNSRCVQLIVNEGPDAGASLEHTHAQLYAMDFVPAAIARERERFRSHHDATNGGELLADIVSEEIRRDERVVAVDDEAVLICPWASRSPFELRLIPRRAEGDFAADDMDGFGVGMLATALRALKSRFGTEPQLNLWIRTAPKGAEPFHWHIDIAPRLSIRASYEIATGVDINIFPPERAAGELREALGDS